MAADLLLNVTHDQYHGDELPGSPRLSRSIAVHLLQGSPLRAWAAHPKLGGEGIQDGDPKRLDHGSLIHSLLLGSGPELVEIYIHGSKDKKKGQDPTKLYPATSYKSDEAQELRDAARTAGCIPVLPHVLVSAKEAAERIRRRLESYGVALGSFETEVTGLWEEGGVSCKMRTDALSLAHGVLLDIKTVERINLRAFGASIEPLGLDIQAAVYPAAVELAKPALAGRVHLEFLLCETSPPHDVAIVPLSPALVDLGRQRWARALKVWKRCLEENRWPGFGIQPPVEPKPWQLEQEFTAALASQGDPAWLKEEA